MNREEWLTSSEAAALLNCSEREIRRRAARADIERLRDGSRVFYKVPPTSADPLPTSADMSAGVADKSAEPDTESNQGFIVLRDAFQMNTQRVRELEVLVKLRDRQKFRWQTATLAALVTIGLAGSGAGVLYGLWRGGAGELRIVSESLATERVRVVEAGDRVKAAERRASMARVEATLTQKRLSESLDRADDLSREVAAMLQENAWTEGW